MSGMQIYNLQFEIIIYSLQVHTEFFDYDFYFNFPLLKVDALVFGI